MSARPRLLLLSPGIIKHTDLDFGLPHLVSLGGYLEHHLPVQVEILDLNYEGGDDRQLERTLNQLGPLLLIGISCYSSFDYLRVVSLARFIRDRFPAVPLVSGGYHASALPRELLGEQAPFDAVVVGEGEIPLRRLVETLLGGGALEPGVHGPEVVEELDSLPPYRWELLERYWPRAHQIGSKLQIYLSRGCPFRCTFCMERAKQAMRWRAYSPGRAVEELERLARFTPLQRWVVNLADPLFGFKRSWRRQVLEEIIRRGLVPRQYWTLTRANDLEEEDVELLARARFSVGVGIESGSPTMLEVMRKAARPGWYLETLERFVALSDRHGLSWAGNVVVGHPGETPRTFAETHRFVERLFAGPQTRGWLSVDPFRLYPGSQVHAAMDDYAQRFGTRFFHRRWWEGWYDTGFRAEHLDPSAELTYAQRVRLTHDSYAPLVRDIARRFKGQGRGIDQVFRRSLDEQIATLGPTQRDLLLARARDATPTGDGKAARISFPIGLQVRDPWVQRREQAVRRLLERGVVRSEPVIEALLSVPPEAHLAVEGAEAMLSDKMPREGSGAPWLAFSAYGLALEALGLAEGARVADLLAEESYVAALLARLVGPDGSVRAVCPGPRRTVRRLRRRLAGLGQVTVVPGVPTTARGLDGRYQGLLLCGALPTLPAELIQHIDPTEGRLVTLLGPRFRAQDLVCATRQGDRVTQRVLARLRAPLVDGPNGWLDGRAR